MPSEPMNEEASFRRPTGSRFITNQQHRHPTPSNASHLLLVPLLRRYSWGCILLLKLIVSHDLSTTSAFISPSLYQPQQLYQNDPFSSTTSLMRRSSSFAVIKQSSRKWFPTRLNASVPKSSQNLHQQPQHLERKRHEEEKIYRRQSTAKREFKTLLRVGLPSMLAGLLAYLTFPFLAMTLASSVNSAGALTVLSTDSSQFVQNFLSVSSLLFSILVGQTCTLRYFYFSLVLVFPVNKATPLSP